MEDLLMDVKKHFAIEEFRYSQKSIIETLLAKKDVLAILPTGAGKSLCYQYPAIKLPGITLVVSPLISLMHDQVEGLKALGISAVCLNKEVSRTQRKQIMKEAAEGRYKILYLSPERLISPMFIRFAKHMDIAMLVVDEAHCISMWGYDFRPDYLKIARFFQVLKSKPILAAFTATATEYIKEDILQLLQMSDPFVVNGGYDRENLQLSVKRCKNNTDKLRAIHRFLRAHKEESGIIYCATVENVQQVYETLCRKKYEAVCYYADLQETEKAEHYRAFMNNEKKIMVATNAFGMGIDKKDIRYVLHFDLPKDIEGYYQEIGRAGRDGKAAECVLYYAQADQKICYALLQSQLQGSRYEEEVKQVIAQLSQKRLQKMIAYAEGGERAGSEELKEMIRQYFLQSAAPIGDSKQIQQFQQTILKRLQSIDVLYTNETKLSKLIRKGDYACKESKEVCVGKKGRAQKPVFFTLEKRLDYFDLMVADAVYTLQAWGREKIYVKNILELLSGDPNITMKPVRSSGEQKDKRQAVLESLDRMMDTQIFIDLSKGDIGHFVMRKEREQTLRGAFLPMKKEGKSGYRLLDIPPLYRYAELTNGQFFTIPQSFLQVKENEKKMPNSIENMKLKHYLARRLILSKPSRAEHGGKAVSRIIRFVQESEERKGMAEILNIDLKEDAFLQKRKWKLLQEKVFMILRYYQSIQQIAEFHRVIGETPFERRGIAGVELQYYEV